jgi:hypothetical protein
MGNVENFGKPEVTPDEQWETAREEAARIAEAGVPWSETTGHYGADSRADAIVARIVAEARAARGETRHLDPVPYASASDVGAPAVREDMQSKFETMP